MDDRHQDPDGRGEAVYLFCFTRLGAPEHVEGAGIDDASVVSLWRCGEIVAVISGASLEEFCGSGAEERLRDLAWLAPRARRHEAMIEKVMRHSPVFPARFGVLFSSAERLENLMQKHYETISRFLDQVEDQEEWAVKGRMNRAKMEAGMFSRALAAQAPSLPAPPGARYLREQRLRLTVQKDLHSLAKNVCQACASDLCLHASVFRERQVPSAEINDNDGAPVSNWSFLIPCADRAAFLARIKKANVTHRPRGIEFEFSGPWPPYSFTPSLEVGFDA
jgi:hypothetical protein